MRVYKLADWPAFKSHCEKYSRLPPARRRQWLFRGQADTEWKLESTLDRFVRDYDLTDRDKTLDALMHDFVRGSAGVGPVRLHDPAEYELELLARHHGLPSPFLDWTQSPYVAAFFALSDPHAKRSKSVSVWYFDRDVFLDNLPELDLVDDQQAIRFNSRAIEQQSLFIRVNSATRPVSEVLDSFLRRFDMPSKIRSAALADLDSMLINDRSLFRDLDGVARMASLRRAIGEDNG